MYELGADGIAGPVIGLLFGNFMILSFEYWLFMVLFSFWQFILVYSSMVLPSALIINASPEEQPAKTFPRVLEGLTPLVWIPLFIGYLIGIMLVLHALGLA